MRTTRPGRRPGGEPARTTARRAALGAILAIALASPIGLAAQERRGCAQCDDASRIDAALARELRAKAASMRQEIARLRRTEHDAAMKHSLAEADAALDRLEPDLRRAQSTLARVLGQLAVAQARSEVNSDRYIGLVQRLTELHSETAEATVRSALASIGQGRSTGWLGVAYSGEPPRSAPGRGAYFRYTTYPVIASVDPDSPAEAAGLLAGDTIVAFNGVDVRNRTIFLSDVLEPGSKLQVRVRRGRATRDVRVRVRARPPAAQLAELDRAGPQPERIHGLTTRRLPSEPNVAPTVPDFRGPATFVFPLPPSAPAPTVRVAPPAPPAPPTPTVGPGYFVWNGPSAVAGAELARMNGDLRDALGVEDGVLVLSVASGSPAASAGLRAGDVILRAAGRRVTSPASVQGVVARAEDRRVELDVVRKKSQRTVLLRW